MKIKLSLFISLFIFQCTSFAQTYQIGHTTISFTDSSRNNRIITAEIYYPSDNEGDNVPLATSTSELFPLLSFGHGFVMTWDAYQNFWEFLVPQGYIMVFPKTEGGIAPSHLNFGKDLAFVLNQMSSFGNDTNSIFYNRISEKKAIMGHSMGGGASFLAAQIDTSIDALVNFAAAETNPSAIDAAESISIPSLIFSGENDCVTPPVSNQIAMYNSLISNCKTLINIIGASHCQMANTNFLCSIGESTCSPQATITRQEQHDIINSFLLPWLDYQLKEDCQQGNVFDNQIINESSITYQKNCIQCNPLSLNDNNVNKVRFIPNPVIDSLDIIGNKNYNYFITIFDLSGKNLINKYFSYQTNIDTSSWEKGIYIYTIQDDNKTYFGKIVK